MMNRRNFLGAAVTATATSLLPPSTSSAASFPPPTTSSPASSLAPRQLDILTPGQWDWTSKYGVITEPHGFPYNYKWCRAVNVDEGWIDFMAILHKGRVQVDPNSAYYNHSTEARCTDAGRDGWPIVIRKYQTNLRIVPRDQITRNVSCTPSLRDDGTPSQRIWGTGRGWFRLQRVDVIESRQELRYSYKYSEDQPDSADAALKVSGRISTQAVNP